MSSDKARAVAVIGPHGSGKSTILSKVKEEVGIGRGRGPVLFSGELARCCPYPVGSYSNRLAQKWIMETQNLLEIFACAFGFPVLLDRNLIDQYAYYRYWLGRNMPMEKMIRDALCRYRAIVFLRGREDFLISDGVRPVLPEIQRKIQELILDNVAIMGSAVREIDVMHPGAVEEVLELMRSVEIGVVESVALCSAWGGLLKQMDSHTLGRLLELNSANCSSSSSFRLDDLRDVPQDLLCLLQMMGFNWSRRSNDESSAY